MGILGKDLLRMDERRFEFTVLFSGDGYEIDGISYPLGALTTAFLNYDAVDFYAGIERQHIGDIKKALRAVPLYGGATRSALPFSLEDCVSLAKDIKLVQTRYAWLLRDMFYRDLRLRTPNRYAVQLEENGLSALISGQSLGTDEERDPVAVSVQFEVRPSATDGAPHIFEKMIFTRLSDFIYTELFRAMMHGSCPRPCRNCGLWFLKEKNDVYEYCANPVPNEITKTCRDVGATASFQTKVRENDVWKLHQRAYKKYYARVLKKTMTKAEFNTWAQEAEQLRDHVLAEYDKAKMHTRTYPLEEYRKELNRI